QNESARDRQGETTIANAAATNSIRRGREEEALTSFARKVRARRRFLPQRRKDAKRCRVLKGFSLRLCAFAGEMSFIVAAAGVCSRGVRAGRAIKAVTTTHTADCAATVQDDRQRRACGDGRDVQRCPKTPQAHDGIRRRTSHSRRATHLARGLRSSFS